MIIQFRRQTRAALAAFLLSGAFASQAAKPIDRPKLVVGIVVDQMRYDFLYRYWDFYGEDGIKKLLAKGYSFDQARYPYAPTVTGPGHASIYTGSTPAFHGIAGNNWYDIADGKRVYCTDDAGVESVGGDAKAGKMSPRNLQSTTIGDQLKLSNQFRSKVIGIALKDRGAILPAGHAANAAYWFDSKSGNYLTSTYYRSDLPGWVSSFNAQKLPAAYGKSTWNTLVPKEQLIGRVATADTAAYERGVGGIASPELPVDLTKLTEKDFEALRTSPFGNQLTTDFALAALKGENLGKGEVPDMLCISYSSTDYVGHSYGPNSVESADVYIRLDREIARLLKAIEEQVGRKNALVFLTADHGICEIPAFMQRNKLPGGLAIRDEAILDSVNRGLAARFGLSNLVISSGDQQLYIDQNLVAQVREGADAVEKEVVRILDRMPFILKAYRSGELALHGAVNPFATRLYLGHNPKRSGQVHFMMKPGYIDGYSAKGTTHSAPYEYDAHVPMVFYGWKIRHGSSSQPVNITDIAPTVCDLLRIMAPSGAIGQSVLHLD